MDLEDLTLSDEYKRCIDNYDELLDALSSQTCYIVSRNLVDRQQVSENYSRLEVWGEQTKLHMLDGSQSFLEEILKTHYQLMNTIRTALRRLTGLLRKGLNHPDRGMHPNTHIFQSSKLLEWSQKTRTTRTTA